MDTNEVAEEIYKKIEQWFDGYYRSSINFENETIIDIKDILDKHMKK